MISCNESIIHAVTTNGELFVWGNDPQNTGIMGIGKMSKIDSPIKVKFPNNGYEAHIRFVTTGQKHASAID